VHTVILTCSSEALISRWKKDTVAEWRGDEKWLSQSIGSLDAFKKYKGNHIVDTSDLSADIVAEKIMEKLSETRNQKNAAKK